MKKLSIVIGLSLGVLATPGLAESPIPFSDAASASTTSSQSEYDKGYEAGLSKCDASYSPSDGSVHIPCIEVVTEEGTVMYKVDMEQIPDLEQFLFSVTNVEPAQ
jgi:hypothetical protein